MLEGHPQLEIKSYLLEFVTSNTKKSLEKLTVAGRSTDSYGCLGRFAL